VHCVVFFVCILKYEPTSKPFDLLSFWNNYGSNMSQPGDQAKLRRGLSRKSDIGAVNIDTLINFDNRFDFVFSIIDDIRKHWTGGYLKAYVIWIIWMVSGTVFYAIRNELGWAKGFYMMVNVGYSIGWGYPVEIDYKVCWYSTINVLFGAVCLSFALSVFTNSITKKSKEWYVTALHQEVLNDPSATWTSKLWHYCLANKKPLLTILAFVVYIFIMVIWALATFSHRWVFIDALYWAISSLSTGGMWPIPQDASDTSFVIGI
jgi:hypothetical protein